MGTYNTFMASPRLTSKLDSTQEIARCAMQYRNNYCDNPAMLAPALVHQCSEWELCMNRDPTKIGRARIGAELIAEVVNGFVEPITWKTLVGFCV